MDTTHNPTHIAPNAPQPTAAETHPVTKHHTELPVVAQAEAPVPHAELQPNPAAAVAPISQPQTGVASAHPQAQVAAQAVHTDAASARAQQLNTLPVEDGDLIEKAWVDTAEDVIAKTKDDPKAEDEMQNQMSKVYLKKRFNIDVS